MIEASPKSSGKDGEGHNGLPQASPLTTTPAGGPEEAGAFSTRKSDTAKR